MTAHAGPFRLPVHRLPGSLARLAGQTTPAAETITHLAGRTAA